MLCLVYLEVLSSLSFPMEAVVVDLFQEVVVHHVQAAEVHLFLEVVGCFQWQVEEVALFQAVGAHLYLEVVGHFLWQVVEVDLVQVVAAHLFLVRVGHYLW